MKEVIVLDIETTGLDEKKDSIIEIAAVRLEGSKVVDRFETLVKPNKNVALTPTIAALTGITEEDIKDATDLNEVKDKLLEFVGDRPIVGHNIGFDIDFLKANDINLPGIGLDTLELSQTLLPKLPFYNLGYLAYQYNFSNLPTHRAMNDVLASVELYDLLLFTANTVSKRIKTHLKPVLEKSNWDWSYIFEDDISADKTYTARKIATPISSRDSKVGELIDVQTLKPGFNVFELPPDLEQIDFNISLAKNVEQSVLVVNNYLFHTTNWGELGFNAYHSNASLLDKQRFEFMLSKDSFNTSELKLIIKILAYGLNDKNSFTPGNIFLTRDEFYLFEQKLIPLEPKPLQIPDNAVMSFSAFGEIVEEIELLKNKTIFVPQWVEFDAWILARSTKLITSAYLNAVVSSRRDFVHDFVEDNKSADVLFKILNELGTHLVMTLAILGMVWQEQQKGSISVTEMDESFLNTKHGTELKSNIQGVISLLTDYSKEIKGLDVDKAVLNRQITHTSDLIKYLQLMVDPTKAHAMYLDVSYDNVFLNIVKESPGNVWQDSLKQLTTVIASNGVSIEGKNSFVGTILGEPTEIQTIPSQATQKEMIFIHGLPDSKGPNYQKQISQYLKHWIEKEPGKSLIVMPNAKSVRDFFDNYQPSIQSVELLSRTIVGKSPVLLKNKLEELNNFSLLVEYFSLHRIVPAISGLDRVGLVRLSFDPPSEISQLLAKDRTNSTFIGYSLPKAIVKFKVSIASLFHQTSEFWILDDRVLEKDYGKIVKKSLKGFKHVELSEDS